jgi:ethanolamine utilization protein EutA
MPDTVKLMGLDFGTTTSSAVVAIAKLTRSAVTGRMELTEVCERYRSEMVFTPLDDCGRLDESRVRAYLDSWLAAADVRPQDIFGGGALVTGLAAQAQNSAVLVQLIRGRLQDALVATANDPCLESWLAFMGNCAALSRAHPHQPILNLDVGGGTTNLAVGVNGEVLRTGCLFVGARHVQVVPGSYRMVKLSRYAQALLEHLGVVKGPGNTLTDGEVQGILDFYLGVLESAATGAADTLRDPTAQLHVQVPLRFPPDSAGVAVTFSGGVGELIYRHLGGAPWPPKTQFGDLGIDLARRIVDSPVWAKDLQAYRPSSGGRATVYGLLRHSIEVSGSTLFLPSPSVLPLLDVPILGRLNAASTDAQIQDIVELARRSAYGGCIQIALGSHDAAAVRALGERIAGALREMAFPPDHPLVILLRENLGKVLGHYMTQWGALAVSLVVIDEIPLRDAQYVRLGTPQSQVVPVSFYGLNEYGASP